MNLVDCLDFSLDTTERFASGSFSTIPLRQFPSVLDWPRLRTLALSTSRLLFLLLELPRFPFVVLGKFVERLRLKDFVVPPSPSATRAYGSGARCFPLSNLRYSHLPFLLPFIEAATPVRRRKTCSVLGPHKFDVICAAAISFDKFLLLFIPRHSCVSVSLGHRNIPRDIECSPMGLCGER